MVEPNKAQKIKTYFLDNLPQCDFCSLRYMEEKHEMIQVRRNILEPVQTSEDRGVMITVVQGNGSGYGATCDFSESGIKKAISEATKFCEISQQYPLIPFDKIQFTHPVGEYLSQAKIEWETISLAEKINLLKQVSEGLKISDKIVEWETSLWNIATESRMITSGGGDMVQQFSHIIPSVTVMANEGSETQARSMESLRGNGKQGGWEVVEEFELGTRGKKMAQEALALLEAPNCPTGVMDLIVDSGQMMLQIHESVGHPLELDRILGDERNFAGTSFVKPEMFGSYPYGSEHMNITYDPTISDELASYAYDDEGQKAEKQYIIEKGTLKRGLGSCISQIRSDLPGVACSRSGSWNRPPIDRMANLNLEPADASIENMISNVEKGVYMKTNRSWSIDDSRNKFQFGCEWGQLIEDGALTTIVKNPNYRGISGIFWRNLKMVGDQSTFHVMGTPYCGKGEPGQLIRTGHAAPTCLFSDVEVFGGEN